ncbi:hypothetical protein [Streptomyces sp. NPDC001642]|uniref:hypothetical protein n=1 Tax=Streptomyces sp. NPDC001642 TaxID=3154392 RepID=UPI00387EDA6B
MGHGGDWHAERPYSTDLLLQKAAHVPDVVHWPAGGCTRQVQALTRTANTAAPTRC